jgi:hypothetical protein
MQKFKQFIKEDLKYISNGTTSSSDVFSGFKYDILKTSNNNYSYYEQEFQVHEMMKKKPNLFCKVLKNSKEQVLMEKLDTRQFKIKITDAFNYEYDNLKNHNLDVFYKTEGLADEIFYILKYSKEYFFENIDNKLIKQYYYKLFDICEYFKNFLNYNQNCYIDLHTNNFGFIKGTQEIRCFDPIFVK